MIVVVMSHPCTGPCAVRTIVLSALLALLFVRAVGELFRIITGYVC